MTDTAGAGGAAAGTGAEGAGVAAGAAAGTGTPSPADVAAAAAAAAGQSQGQQQAAADGAATAQGQQPGAESNPWDDPVKARAEIERLRRERGDERINAKNQAAQDGARKALAEAAKLAGLEIPGLTDTDAAGAADPKVLAEQITSTTSERDAARTELAVTNAAWAAGVNPAKVDLLHALLSRSAEFRALDSTAADYPAKLAAAVAAQVAAEPTLKLTGSVNTSGAEQFGGANGQSAITQEAFNAMTLNERGRLRATDRATYDRLVAGQ